MTTDRFEVEIQDKDLITYFADVEAHYLLDINYGEDRDGNRGEPQSHIEEIEIVSIWDIDLFEIDETEELRELIETAAREKRSLYGN